VKRAQQAGKVAIRVHDLRDYTRDRHKTVDDKPFGGGPGMVMKPEPIFECVEDVFEKHGKGWIIVLDPQGERLTQALAEKLARKKHLVLVCGHYEGIDYRVHEHLADQAVSIGDFVTMGGEAPALCMIEAVTRLVPGVLGNEKSLEEESFNLGMLEYPHYTRPRDFRGHQVPDVLVSGNHKEVEKWRHRAAREHTRRKRPDLKTH
jgi:tRNA (guanine37-N1)-methyltransferase